MVTEENAIIFFIFDNRPTNIQTHKPIHTWHLANDPNNTTIDNNKQ